jgi:hypothetical protein
MRSWRGWFLQSSGIWRLYVRIWLLVAHSIYILRPNLALCRITHVKSELSISYHPHGIWQALKNWWVLPACTRLLTMKCVRLIHAQHFSPPRDTHPPLEQLEWHNSDGVGLAPWYQISLSKCQQTDRIGSVWIGNADNSRYVHCPCDHSLFLPYSWLTTILYTGDLQIHLSSLSGSVPSEICDLRHHFGYGELVTFINSCNDVACAHPECCSECVGGGGL